MAWYSVFKTAAAVGETLWLSAKSAKWLQDVHLSPLAAVEKSDPSSGAKTGEFRIITDLKYNGDGNPGWNEMIDSERFPPTVCPALVDLAVTARYLAYM